jgi:hypothetical protein
MLLAASGNAHSFVPVARPLPCAVLNVAVTGVANVEIRLAESGAVEPVSCLPSPAAWSAGPRRRSSTPAAATIIAAANGAARRAACTGPALSEPAVFAARVESQSTKAQPSSAKATRMSSSTTERLWRTRRIPATVACGRAIIAMMPMPASSDATATSA